MSRSNFELKTISSSSNKIIKEEMYENLGKKYTNEASKKL